MSRTTRIKICGLCRPEDVEYAVQLGVEYLGFVFAPGSPRRLDPERARDLLSGIDTRGALRVGVFCDQPAVEVNAIVQQCGLDLVQLHGHEPRDFPGALVVPVLRALHVPAAGIPEARAAGAARLERAPQSAIGRGVALAPNVLAVLLDAVDESGRSGGLGRRMAPAALAAALASLPPAARVFLSGGLDPGNVAAIAARWAPFAVDVSSGVETAPGIKDHDRMRRFVAALEDAA